MDKRAREPEFLLHTAGEFACEPFCKRLQVGKLQQIILLLEVSLFFNRPEGCKKLKILINGQLFVQAESLGHVSYHHACLCLTVYSIRFKYFDRAAVGCHNAGKESHKCCFSCTVRANQSKQVSFIYAQIDAAYSLCCIKRFYESRGFNSKHYFVSKTASAGIPGLRSICLLSI